MSTEKEPVTIAFLVGQRLKKLRKARKATQTEVAHIIGIDQPALSRIEHGRQHLTVEQWVRFCIVYKVTDTMTRALKTRMKKAEYL
jgi:transcriptional regulator with XRE-family HTH domain